MSNREERLDLQTLHTEYVQEPFSERKTKSILRNVTKTIRCKLVDIQA